MAISSPLECHLENLLGFTHTLLVSPKNNPPPPPKTTTTKNKTGYNLQVKSYHTLLSPNFPEFFKKG
jgi:hypothetical protein